LPIRTARPVYKGQLTPEAQAFPIFGAVLDHKLTLDDVLQPSFWHAQSKTLEAGARIRCEWEDGSRSALLRVMGKDAAAKEVLVTAESVHEFPAPAAPAGFTLEFVNKNIGWRILEAGRRSPRRTGFATAFAAAHWLVGDRGPKDAPEPPAAEIAAEAKKDVQRAGAKKPGKPEAETSPPAAP
jgi:hypothetical protein